MDSIRRSGIPRRVQTLLGWPHIHKFPGPPGHNVPTLMDMSNQSLSLVLGQNTNPTQVRVEAIGQREVDIAEMASEGDRGLALPPRQTAQAGPVPSGQDERQRVSRMISGIRHVYLGVAPDASKARSANAPEGAHRPCARHRRLHVAKTSALEGDGGVRHELKQSDFLDVDGSAACA